MILFPVVVFWGLRGIFSTGVVDMSDFGWGFVPKRGFTVPFPCFGGAVFCV